MMKLTSSGGSRFTPTSPERMVGEVSSGWEERSVGQEGPVLPECASTWRLQKNSEAEEVSPRKGPVTRDRSPPKKPRAGCLKQSPLLDPSVQLEFRTAARSMLERLVTEHERILAKHLQLVIEEGVGGNPKKESLLEPPAPVQAAEEGGGHSSVVSRQSDGGGSASSMDSPLGVAPRTTGVQRMVGSYAKQRSFVRLTIGSFGSTDEEAKKVATETSVIDRGRNSCRKLREMLRVKEELLEAVMGVAIILDLISLGIATRFSRSKWLAVDTALAVFFTLELLREMAVSGCHRFFRREAWRKNVFEVLLVGLTWVDIGAARRLEAEVYSSDLTLMFLIVRLLRVVRVFRVRAFNELFMMVNGVIGSYKTLLYSLVLISLPLYCVALVLTETLGAQESGLGAQKFGHLEEALFTVFRCFVASDCTQEDGKPLIVLLADSYGWGYGMLYCVVQFGMTFGLYNVITAIYVEKSVCAAKFNELAVKRRRFQDRQYFEAKAKAMLEVIWAYYFAHEDPSKGGAVDFDLKAAGRLQLTRGFFDQLCKQPSFVNILRSLDISEDDQLDLFETLDIDARGTIDPMSLVIGVGKLRGEARKADIVTMGLILRSVQNKLENIEAALAARHSFVPPEPGGL